MGGRRRGPVSTATRSRNRKLVDGEEIHYPCTTSLGGSTLYWGHKTKTTKAHPFRPDTMVVIEGAYTNQIYQYLRCLSPNTHISTLSSMEITRFFRRHLGRGYSSHSIKRGAIHQLMEHVAGKRITLEEVMRIANHRQLPSLLRYSGVNEHTARALGTQSTTRLL